MKLFVYFVKNEKEKKSNLIYFKDQYRKTICIVAYISEIKKCISYIA